MFNVKAKISMCKISIITVVYNNKNTIEKTINSILSQTYKDFEYIIIDGKSTDGTIEIINKYIYKIKKIISEPDKGIYDAMNKGIKYCSGEWILFMNSGDILKDNNTLQNIFSQNIPKNVNFIYSDFQVKNNKSIDTYKASFKKGILLHQSIIYKTKKHKEYGNYLVTSKYIVSDYIFFLQFKENEVFKTPYVISVNEEAGVSASNWCGYQKICCDYIFSRITIIQLIIKLIERVIKNTIKRAIK